MSRKPSGVNDFDRLCAARLMRAARHAGTHRASEHLDWAMFLAPSSRPLERARIRLYIQEHNLEAAESLIARSLLSHPEDHRLRIMRAQCLALRWDFIAADRELREVLAQRPHRCDALVLAAHVASQLGEHARAIGLLERALILKPRHDNIVEQLSTTLLNTGEFEDAEQAESLLASMGNPPPALLARAFIAQGRVLDAIEYLEARLDAPCYPKHRDILLVQYVSALETAGHMDRINDLLRIIKPLECPRAAIALARTMLAMGRFDRAAALTMFALRSGPAPTAVNIQQTATSNLRVEALPVLTVAATMAGRLRIADRARHAWHACTASDVPSSQYPAWIDAWRRGIRGDIIRNQHTALTRSTIGGDPPSSVLQPLLRTAHTIIEKQIILAPSESRELEYHAMLCRSAMTGTPQLCAEHAPSA